MDVIDTHHHLWDLEKNRYPWLVEPIDHFIGDYSAIRRTYVVADLLSDAGDLDLVGSVHVQAEFDHEDDPVKETAWLQSVHDEPTSRGLPSACVAFADLLADDIDDVLARHCEHPIMRGIRYMLNYADEPRFRFASRGDLMGDAGWRSGYARLAKYGLSFDLQVWPWQLEEGAALAGEFPDIPVILNHTGMPMNRDEEGLSIWCRGLRALAGMPNTSVKISGLPLFDRAWTTDSIRPFVLDTIEIMGVDRCMFGTNFPVDGLMAQYGAIWSAYQEITADFSKAEQEMLFHANARRVYRL